MAAATAQVLERPQLRLNGRQTCVTGGACVAYDVSVWRSNHGHRAHTVVRGQQATVTSSAQSRISPWHCKQLKRLRRRPGVGALQRSTSSKLSFALFGAVCGVVLSCSLFATFIFIAELFAEHPDTWVFIVGSCVSTFFVGLYMGAVSGRYCTVVCRVCAFDACSMRVRAELQPMVRLCDPYADIAHMSLRRILRRSLTTTHA